MALSDHLLRAYEQVKAGVFISDSMLWPGRSCLRLSKDVNAGEVLFYGGGPSESSGWRGRILPLKESEKECALIWRQEFTRAKEDRVTQRRYLLGNAERCLWPHLIFAIAWHRRSQRRTACGSHCRRPRRLSCIHREDINSSLRRIIDIGLPLRVLQEQR